MNTWLLFAGFLISSFITAKVLHVRKYNMAFPLYLLTFGFLSSYILFFSGCSLIMGLASYILDDAEYFLFSHAMSLPMNSSLPFASTLYASYIAISVFILVGALIAAVTAIKLVIRLIDNKEKHLFSHVKTGGNSVVRRRPNTVNRPELSCLCRYNC